MWNGQMAFDLDRSMFLRGQSRCIGQPFASSILFKGQLVHGLRNLDASGLSSKLVRLPLNFEPDKYRQVPIQWPLICLSFSEFWCYAEDLNCSWGYLMQRLSIYSQYSSPISPGGSGQKSCSSTSQEQLRLSALMRLQTWNLLGDQIYSKFLDYRFNSCLTLSPRTTQAQVCLPPFLLTLAPKSQVQWNSEGI